MTKRYYKFKETHRTVFGRKQKYCTKCKKWKSESEYGIDRFKRDGLNIRCKDCYKAYTRALHKKYRKGRKVRVYLRFVQRHRVFKGVEQKRCSKCGRWKDYDKFYRNTAQKDGLMEWCRNCSYKAAGRTYGPKSRRNMRYEDRHRLVDGAKEKLCTKCGKWKKENEYYKQRSNKDGISARCRKCSYTSVKKSHKGKTD